MGFVEIENLLKKDGKKRTLREISEKLGTQPTNVNSCLRKMLKYGEIEMEIHKVQTHGRNNYYEKEVRFWFIKMQRIKKKKANVNK